MEWRANQSLDGVGGIIGMNAAHALQNSCPRQFEGLLPESDQRIDLIGIELKIHEYFVYRLDSGVASV